MADKTAFVEEISKMSVLEVSELVKALEEKFGVKAAAPTAFAPATTGPGYKPSSPCVPAAIISVNARSRSY